MALNIDFGGDNEYISAAEKARRDAESKGGPSIIASVLDALGIHRQVAKEPKASSAANGTPDLGVEQGKANAAPKPQPVTNESGDVVGTVTPKPSVLDQAAAASGIQPLPMTTSAAPMGNLSSQGVPRPLQAIDPDLGMAGIIKPLGLK